MNAYDACSGQRAQSSPHGSLASRLAHTFVEEIVKRASHGIDLHTGGAHRMNLPHIRGNLDDPETERLARAFGTPVAINANLRDGSLRQLAAEMGFPMLLYEAGEALRFDRLSIRAGLRGRVRARRMERRLFIGKLGVRHVAVDLVGAHLQEASARPRK